MRHAFSLLEMIVTLTISMILLTLALPPLSQARKDVAFEQFASQLTGHLVLAKQRAYLTGRSVWIDFTATEGYLFHSFTREPNGNQRLLASAAKPNNRLIHVKNALPSETMKHPTLNRSLEKPLRSTHNPKVIFTPWGSSSATIVYSDQKQRVVCAVVSSQTGRIRVFLRNRNHRDWIRIY